MNHLRDILIQDLDFFLIFFFKKLNYDELCKVNKSQINQLLKEKLENGLLSLKERVHIYWESFCDKTEPLIVQKLYFFLVMTNGRLYFAKEDELDAVNCGFGLLKSFYHDNIIVSTFQEPIPFNFFKNSLKDEIQTNPNQDLVFKELIDRIPIEKGNVGQFLIANIIRRAKGQNLFSFFQASSQGIKQTSILNKLKFSKKIQVLAKEDELDNSPDVKSIINWSQIGDKFILNPTNSHKADLIVPIEWEENQLKDLPSFTFQIKNYSNHISPSQFEDIMLPSLNPNNWYSSASNKRKEFISFWDKNPNFFDIYIRCVASVYGFSDDVKRLVTKYNEIYGDFQPILLLEPNESLIGSDFWKVLHPSNETKKSKRTSINYDVTKWRIEKCISELGFSVLENSKVTTESTKPIETFFFREEKKQRVTTKENPSIMIWI